MTDRDMDAEMTAPQLTKAQKRDLLTAYRSPVGEAYGLCHGPMSALTQTHRLAHEIFLPRTSGFHIRINQRGRAIAAVLAATRPAADSEAWPTLRSSPQP